MNRTTVRTFTGSEVDLLVPAQESISIEDIAHHLSKLDRYNGAGSFPYSVAHHSLLVASILPNPLKLWGLLHDATEAYLGDVVSPLKKLLPEFSEIEAVLQEEILRAVGHPHALSSVVIDNVMLRLSWRRNGLLGYRDIEQNLMKSIATRFRLQMPRPVEVKSADRAVMVAEMEQVMNWPDLASAQATPSASVRIYSRSWQSIRNEFLERFDEYKGLV